MKLACIDKTASARLMLQTLVVEAFNCSRESIGHLPVLDFSPATKEEIVIGGLDSKDSINGPAWAGVVIGPGYETEELFGLASEIRSSAGKIPIFCFVTPENYSMRVLRRLERVSAEVLRTDDSSIRIVHSIFKSISARIGKSEGKLVTIDGAKGGIGASSIVLGIAHAALAEGKSTLVVDLSKEGSLFHYLQTQKWQSSAYRTLLVDRLNASKTVLDRLVVEAPNGIKLFLPPAGGADIRELWLRSPQSLEVTLGLIELFKERYDLVLIDLARSEGLLPFSLVTRADIRLVISSNEPASVHLLNDKLTELRELPTLSRTIVLLNLLVQESLTAADIEDFLVMHEASSSIEILSLPFDPLATSWIGTGNSIYTEGSQRLQSILRGLASAISLGGIVPSDSETVQRGRGIGWLTSLNWRRKTKRLDPALLPPPSPSQVADGVNFILTDELKSTFQSVAKSRRDSSSTKDNLFQDYRSPLVSKISATGG